MTESFSVKAILSATDKGFSSAMKSASQSITNLKSTVTSGLGFGIMAGIGQSAFNALKNTVTGFTGSIINTGATFQAEMSRVQAISGATASEFEKLRKQAIQLGADTSFSSTEVAQGMENLAAAGFATNEIMSAMPGLLNMAAASGENLATSSDIAASTLRGFGLAAEDMSHVADVLAENANRTNSSVSQTGEAMKYIAPLARAAGISFEETAAAIGIMANAGIQGSQAGTTLRGALSRLSKPTDTMITAMKQLGVSFYDSSGKMKPLSEQIGMLKNAMSGMTDEQRNNYLVTLYGQEALSGMLALINEGEGSLNSLTEAYRKCDGSAEKAAETMLNNFNGAVEEMNGSVESLGISIFYSLSEPLTAAVKSITEFVNKANAAFESGGIDKKIKKFVDNASKYWEVFRKNAVEVGKAFGDAFSAIGDSLSELNGAFGSTESIKSFSDVITAAKDALVGFAGFLEDNSDAIAKVITQLPKLFVAYKGFQILRSITPLVSAFSGAILSLGSSIINKIAPNLTGISKGQDAVGKSSVKVTSNVLQSAQAFALMGAGILLVSGGFALLAKSSIALAESGGAAIAVMVGMVAAVVALGAGFTVMTKAIAATPAQLQALGVALVALGASVLLVSAGFAVMTQSSIALSEAGTPAIATMFGMVAAMGALMVIAALIGKQLTSASVGLVAFGTAILIAGAGMYVMSSAAISLTNAGTPAIAVMAGMVVAMAALMALAAALGPALTAGSIGFIAFGAAIVLVASGALIASAALAVVAAVLPTVSEYGSQGAVAIAELGAAMLVFAAGSAAAGVASVALAAGLVAVGASAIVAATGTTLLAAGATTLGAGLLIVTASGTALAAVLPMLASGALSSAAGFTALLASATGLSVIMLALTAAMAAFAVSSTASTVALLAFSAAMAAGTVGTAAMAAALVLVNSSMKSIATNAKSAQSSIASMRLSLDVVNEGLDALGNKAKSAVNKLISTFSNSAGKAKSAGKKVGDSINDGVKSGLDQLPNTANNAMNRFNSAISAGGSRAVSTARSMTSSIISALNSAQSGAYSAGYNIGAGLANGMSASLGRVQSIAAQLAAAAERAIRAEAQIHSPSRVTDKLGQYFGEGWVQGILSMAKDAKQATEELIAIPSLPDVPTPSLAGSGGGNWELSEDYSYTRNAKYTIVVPVNLEGKEVSRITAPFMEGDLRKREKVNNMINGIR